MRGGIIVDLVGISQLAFEMTIELNKLSTI